MNVPNIKLNSGHQMPQFGLGVWQASDQEATAAVLAALQDGYRMIDTAEVYRNERGVGRGVRESGLPREDIFVTTKYWPQGGYAQAIQFFEQSLALLDIDYVDLFLIHWPPEPREAFLETWRAYIELLGTGRVKSIGVSNFAMPHLELLADNFDVLPAVNQVEIHPDMQQRELVAYCNRKGIAVEAWSPLGGSSRSDKSLLENPIIGAIARKHGKSPAQAILRWHIQAGHIVIPKSVHAARIRENSEIFDFALDEEDLARIDTLDDPDNRVGPDPAEVRI